MYSEEKLVPFQPTDLSGKRVLVIAPHPDDETFGCGGSLALHTQAGDAVKVVFLTNGAKGEASGETAKESYVRIRQDEAETACKCLGIIDLDFWGYEDRDLAGSRGVLVRLIDLLDGYQPELVYAPSLLEFHPDHRATAVLLYEAIRVCELKFEVAFYEVGQPLSVNCLVDITPVLKEKGSAADAYSSQLRERAYKDVCLALNRFRSLTLPEGITHAEGFALWPADMIRKTGLYAIAFPKIHSLKPEAHEAGPLVSVIVRTKDRPEYLACALRSVVSQTYANLEVVLVNDGGQDVENLARSLCGHIPVVHVRHEESRGRSTAANAGLDHARGTYIIFLDDDDWFEPNHIASLVTSLREDGQAQVAYTGVTAVFDDDGTEPREEMVFNAPFDLKELRAGNYIPLHAALFQKSLLHAGVRFDEGLEVYEDWDFLLQLAQLTRFRHLDQISAVYRATGESGVGLRADNAKVRQAREAIYEKWQKNWSGAELNTLIMHMLETRKELASHLESLKKENMAKDVQIEQLRHTKDFQIQSLQSELHLIKQSKAWRLAESFRGLVYGKLLRRFPSLQQGLPAIIGEDFSKRVAKTTRHLRGKNHTLNPEFLSKEYSLWIKRNELDSQGIDQIKNDIACFDYTPPISIIMPVYNVERIWLEKAIDSVISQLYEKWELCIVDDGSTKSHIKETLKRYADKDQRIKVKYLTANQGIAGASNEALSLTTGEFVGFLDHDDELTIDALYENVKSLNKNPETDLIYSDEDKVDMKGERSQPFFKPDWSPDLFLAVNYLCHLTVVRKSILEEVGGFRKGFDGSQDFDLFLRVIERTDKIAHIPKILYHWRMLPDSTSYNISAKKNASSNGIRALEDYLRRNQIHAEVFESQSTNYRVEYLYHQDPLVSIIIPFKDKISYLKKCIRSIQQNTEKPRYEIILVSNNSEDRRTFDYLESIKSQENIKLLKYNHMFNFARINNFAEKEADGEYLLFLNNDTEVLSHDWLHYLLMYAQRDDVGCVGAKLLYPNDTIQHAGIVLGLTGMAGHVFSGLREHQWTYFGLDSWPRNYLAVTGACLMIDRRKFREVGGFDENFVICGSDVALCIKIFERGYRNIYVPYARLIHHESVSRGSPIPVQDFAESWRSYRRYLENGDPFYNQNLTLEDTSCRTNRFDNVNFEINLNQVKQLLKEKSCILD